VVRTPAQDLPFEDGTFDAVVSTPVLCGVGRPAAGAARTAPGAPAGRPVPVSRAPALRRPAAGPAAGPGQLANRLVVCWDCNRPTLDSIQEASFTITHLEHMTLPKAPKFVGPAIMGSATTPACRPRRR
jgi:hypothetical protein